MPKLPGSEMSEEAQISTQRDGQDPGTINDSWNTSAGRGQRPWEGMACRRPEERQASQVPREPLKQGCQRAILEGICTIGAEQSRSPGGQEEKR